GAAADGSPGHGIFVWDDAPSVTVSANRVAGAGEAAIAIEGGAGHVLAANELGTTKSGTPAPVDVGISLTGVSATTVGPGNTILTDGAGVRASGSSPTVTVTGNTITGPGTGTGVALSTQGGDGVVSQNQVEGF